MRYTKFIEMNYNEVEIMCYELLEDENVDLTTSIVRYNKLVQPYLTDETKYKLAIGNVYGIVYSQVLDRPYNRYTRTYYTKQLKEVVKEYMTRTKKWEANNETSNI